jgi:hypothetical protein
MGTDAVKMAVATEIQETGAMNYVHIKIKDGHRRLKVKKATPATTYTT